MLIQFLRRSSERAASASASARAESSSPAAARSSPLSRIAARPQRRAASSISTARHSKDSERRPAAIRSHSSTSTGRQRKRAWGFCRQTPTRQQARPRRPPSRLQASAPNSAKRHNTLIAAGAGSTIALTWLGPLTNGQLLIGSTNAYPVPATLVGTSGIGISLSAGGIVISGSGTIVTFIEDSGSATAASGFLYLYGSAFQGLRNDGQRQYGHILQPRLDDNAKGRGDSVDKCRHDNRHDHDGRRHAGRPARQTRRPDKIRNCRRRRFNDSTDLAGAADKWPAPHRQHQCVSSSRDSRRNERHRHQSQRRRNRHLRQRPVVTFIEDSGSATAASGFLYLYGSAFQGQGTTASGNTVTFFNLDWTTTQKGVGILSTNADTTTGTTTTAAVTPAVSSRQTRRPDKILIASGAGSTIALTWLGPLTNGQLLIGSTNAYPVPATLVGMSGIGISQSAQAESLSPEAARPSPLSKIAARQQRRAASSISTARLSKD